MPGYPRWPPSPPLPARPAAVGREISRAASSGCPSPICLVRVQ